MFPNTMCITRVPNGFDNYSTCVFYEKSPHTFKHKYITDVITKHVKLILNYNPFDAIEIIYIYIYNLLNLLFDFVLLCSVCLVCSHISIKDSQTL